MVIIVSNKLIVKQFVASNLRFGKMVKKVEKFWKADPRSIYLRYCGIGHKHSKKYGNRPKKCVMYTGEYQVNN